MDSSAGECPRCGQLFMSGPQAAPWRNVCVRERRARGKLCAAYHCDATFAPWPVLSDVQLSLSLRPAVATPMQATPSASWLEMRPGPVLLAVIPDKFTDEDFTREFDEMSRVLRDAGERLRLLIVLGQHARPSDSNRARAKRFFEEEKGMLRSKVSKAAVVSSSNAIRVAVSTANFVGLFPFKTKAFQDRPSAEAWLRN